MSLVQTTILKTKNISNLWGKKKMKINFKKIFTTIAALSMLVGCGGEDTVVYDQTYDTKNYKDFVTIGNDVNSFNYLASHLAANLVVTQNLNDSLVETDKYGNMAPQLAESWETEDYQTWTFHLKKGVKWSDSAGNVVGEVKADDFVYGLEYVLDPVNGVTSNLHFAYLIDGAEEYYKEMTANGTADFSKVGVKAIDDYTVQYTCKTPMSYFLSAVAYTSFKPASRAFITSIPDEDGVKGTSRFGTTKDLIWYCGPYILTEFVLDTTKTLTKNENYHDIDKVTFDTVEILAIKDAESALEYFERGELSRAPLSAFQVKAQQDKNSPYLIQMPLSSSTYGMLLNNQGEYEGSEDTNKAVNNENFRKSLMYGIDADAYNEVTILGDVAAVRATTVTAEDYIYDENGKDYSTYGSLADWSSIDYLYDPEKALQYKEKAMDELKAEGVTFPIKFVNVYAAGNETEAQKAEIMKQCLEETLGEDYIEVINDTYATNWFSEVMATNEYTVYVRGWGPDFKDPSNILGVWQTNSKQMNGLVMHYEIPEFDAMFAAANAITDDVEKRYAAFAECEAYLLEHAYYIPMVTNGGTYQVTTVNLYSKAYTKGDSQRYTGWEAYDHVLTAEEMNEFKVAWETERAKVLASE